MLTLLLGSTLLLSGAGDERATLAWQGLVDHYAKADALDLDVNFQMIGDDTPYRCEMRLAKGQYGAITMTHGEMHVEYVGNGKGFYVLNGEQETYLRLPGGFMEAPVVGYLSVLRNWAGAPLPKPTRLTWLEQTPPNPLMRVIEVEFPGRLETLWIDPDNRLLAASLDIKAGEVSMAGHVTFARAAALRGIKPRDFSTPLPEHYSAVAGSQELLLPVGLEAPDVTLFDLDGKSFQLDDLRGKTVLLNFWFYT